MTSVRPLTIVAELSGGVPVAGANVTWNRCVNALGTVASLANFTSRKIRVSWNGPTVLVLPVGNARIVASRSAPWSVATIVSADFVCARIVLGRIERLETIERHGRRRHIHDKQLIDEMHLAVGSQHRLG